MEESWYELHAHPGALVGTGAAVKASTALRADQLVVRFELCGNLAALSLPRESPLPGRRDRLWEHTCFEAFIGAAEGAYVELNLSPSGDWAIWVFDDYRQGMRPALLRESPSSRVQRGVKELRTDASLSLASLREEIGAPPYHIGLAAVLEGSAGQLSYWACRHPLGPPDFHARAGWTGWAGWTVLS